MWFNFNQSDTNDVDIESITVKDDHHISHNQAGIVLNQSEYNSYAVAGVIEESNTITPPNAGTIEAQEGDMFLVYKIDTQYDNWVACTIKFDQDDAKNYEDKSIFLDVILQLL